MHADGHGNMQATLKWFQDYIFLECFDRDKGRLSEWWRNVTTATRQFCQANGVPLVPKVDDFGTFAS